MAEDHPSHRAGTHSDASGPGGTDPAERARVLMDRGVEAVRADDFELGHALLEEAEQIAAAAGIPPTAIAAHINRGWAAWVAGDADAAILLYTEGAEMAREAGDIERLRVALANLGTALRKTGRAGEAVAGYERYLPDLADDPTAAAEALLDLGMILEETGALDAATERYWDAYELARDNDLPEETGTAAVMLGQTYAAMGESGRADACFREAADVFRAAEDSAHLADVLYAHALTLRGAGEVEAALALWREEEALRRDLGDDVGLADCLFQQLLAVEGREHDPNANLRFAEAGDAYRRGGAPERAADVRHTHARWLRAREMDDQALVRVREAIDLLAEAAEPMIECQVRGLHAMMLADAGDFVAAAAELNAAELNAAEAAGTLAEDEVLVVGVLARRAYVRACEGASPEDVVAELDTVVEHARAIGSAGVGAYATSEVSEEITARCGSEYREPLAAFRRGLRGEQ